MNFIDILNGLGFRFIIIFISSSLLLLQQTWASIVGVIISLSYFISLFISYAVSDKEILLYHSLIYRGYIQNSEENKHNIFILFDQIILSVLYLLIYIGLYKVKTDNNSINSGLLKIILGMILILVLFKNCISIYIDDSWGEPSFNTIQSYVYSSIVCIILLIYYLITNRNPQQGIISQDILMILMIITSFYLILSPLVNYFNDVECKYFKKKENCDLKSDECSYKGNKCIELSPLSLCSSYKDESSCNNGNNCYYVTNRDDVSDLTEDKLKGLTECINSDEKCKGKYKSSCSATFEPTNRFKECCYDTLFEDSNCIESEMLSRMNSDQIIKTRKEENNTQEGRVGDYSLQSGEKQIEYEAVRGYCSESNIRKDMEAGIYA